MWGLPHRVVAPRLEPKIPRSYTRIFRLDGTLASIVNPGARGLFRVGCGRQKTTSTMPKASTTAFHALIAMDLPPIAEGDQRADPAQLRRGQVRRAAGPGEAIAEILRISARKADRVKKRFVEEGMEAALGGRQGRHPSYVRKAHGVFEARLVALSCAGSPEGHSQWSLRLLADRVVELGHIDRVSHETVRRVLEKRDQTVAARRLGDSPAGQRGLRGGDGEGSRRLPTSLRCGLFRWCAGTRRPGN